MSNSEEGQPLGAVDRPPPSHTTTVVSNHEGEDSMGSRSMTVGRYEEVRRRLAEGRGLREIARAPYRRPRTSIPARGATV